MAIRYSVIKLNLSKQHLPETRNKMKKKKNLIIKKYDGDGVNITLMRNFLHLGWVGK